MSVVEIASLGLAGLAAGAINSVVGSGTLLTFPVLLGFGYSPVTANVANMLGFAPGSVSGAWGYRTALAGQRARAIRLGATAVLGGVTGAVLLLVLPASTFAAIVPGFIALALVLTALQPRSNSWLQKRDVGSGRGRRVLTLVAVYATAVYGGYFGAGQGILLLAILGVMLAHDLQRTNALKNVLTGSVNGVARVFFMLAAHVEWRPAAIIAIASIVGAQLGARYGQRLKPTTLRAIVLAVGILAIVALVAS
jgi:uncharacterized membrane protein YfcA